MQVLTINTGSSSLKAALYQVERGEALLFACAAERIGAAGSKLRILGADGVVRQERNEPLATHVEALAVFVGWLDEQGKAGRFDAAGHRIVAGSQELLAPRRFDASLRAALATLLPLAPDHLPQALAAMDWLTRRCPGLPQAVCSDSAFHRTLPEVARFYPLPRRWRERGLEKQGFHGLSCEYVLETLRADDAEAAQGRLIIAHLGNGASLTAVRAGRSVDTTMGLTPAGGLIMSSRSGDLDPGVLIYLLTAGGIAPADLNRLVNRESGLLGLSGWSGDMRELLAGASGHAGGGGGGEESASAAALAIASFVYQARKFLAAMAATLSGLDTLIFTGGIGENAAVIRERICAGMDWMGISLDAERNRRHGPVISSPASAVTVRVIATDEDRMIARHTAVALARPVNGTDAERKAGHVSI